MKGQRGWDYKPYSRLTELYKREYPCICRMEPGMHTSPGRVCRYKGRIWTAMEYGSWGLGELYSPMINSYKRQKRPLTKDLFQTRIEKDFGAVSSDG